jgi:acetyl-CoA acetyltransferase
VARRVAVVGIADSDYGVLDGATNQQLLARMAREAILDAGLSREDVDGLLSTGGGGGMMPIVALGEYLGVQPRLLGGVMVGGSVAEFCVEHAVAAIEAGIAEVIVVVHASTERSQLGRSLGTARRFAPAEGHVAFEDPFGCPLVGRAALVASRHMHEFGTTPEQLAEVSVAMRRNAARNPKAMYRDPISVADVLESRMICDPLHKLDCCVISDAAAALVLTTEARARDLGVEPVWVLGTGEQTTHETIAGWPDFGVLSGAATTRAAYERAGVRPQDIDVWHIYDSYTITMLLSLEAVGLCERGESGAFVEGGRLAHDGDAPTNPDGGALSSNHGGMRGIFLLVEAVRQLRGDAGPTQVPGPEVALCLGTGGPFSSCGTVILGRG